MWKEEASLGLSQWSKITSEGQCMSLFEQPGVRVEPGATCVEGIAGMGVVLEAMGKAGLRAGSSHRETREVRRVFREIVREA